MIKQKIQEAFNDQINEEIYSSYLYLSMAAYFESEGLKGFAQWMRVQVQEENFHAMKFFDFVLERGGKVALKQINTPKTQWTSPLEAFEDAYKHECHITERINGLVDLALAEKAHAENAFLQWFVTEQVEEEANTMGVVDQLKLSDGNNGLLLMLDRELGKRVFTPPTTPIA